MKYAKPGVFLFLPALLLGCGGPQPIGISGSVKYKDEPVANVNVVFLGPGGATATGVTDAQGNFSSVTSAAGKGALPGEYVVTITPSATVSDEPISAPNAYSTESTESPFPVRYADSAGTPLKATVAPDKTKFDFVLTDS